MREFLNSGHNYWEVETKALPSKDIKVILSSLKWRIKNKDEFKNKIRIFTRKRRIYLERVKNE